MEGGAGGGAVVRLEARLPIPAGQEITVSYYSSLLGTHKRRRRLRAEWYIDCTCPRCQVTEITSMASCGFWSLLAADV